VRYFEQAAISEHKGKQQMAHAKDKGESQGFTPMRSKRKGLYIHTATSHIQSTRKEKRKLGTGRGSIGEKSQKGHGRQEWENLN